MASRLENGEAQKEDELVAEFRNLRTRCRALMLELLLLLAGVLCAAPAHAQSDASFYVSDQFKKVAKRIVVQIGASEIRKACPANQPLCEEVADGVANAFSSAVSGDRTALKASLNDFMVRSSVAAALSTSVGDLVRTDAAPVVARGVSPLLRCVEARLSGKRSSGDCRLTATERANITFLFKVAFTGLSKRDKQAVMAAWRQILQERRLQPEVALAALAALASSDQIDRPDLRVYFLALADWARQGLTSGLFDATYSYLVNLNDNVAAESAAADLLAHDFGNWDFWTPAADASIEGGIANCPNAKARFAAWKGVRDGALKGWRAQMLRGLPVDLAPLVQLETMSHCADASGDKLVEKLRRHVRYARASLTVHQAMVQYGSGALMAAMLLDYVRNHDEIELERNLRMVLLFTTARFELLALNEKVPDAPSFTTPAAVLRSCEYQTLALDFSVPVARISSDPTHCYGLFDGQLRSAPTKATPVTEADVLATLTALKQQVGPLVAKSALFDEVTSDAHLAELAKAIDQLAQGDKAGAERTLIRVGIDVLVASVDEMSTALFNVSEESCKSDARSRSIFTGLGAGCATHLLIQAAYHPIADWYWDKGANADQLSDVADSVYRALLSSPYLDSTPVIFNVGLGANYVLGPEDTWGKHGYGALTLLDKFGLTFYRRDWDSFRLETGPFVGGFLDALVRTAANSDKERRYWLLGYTAGLPRMWSADFGLELHAAAVMPFDLGRSSRYGFAMGGALVVPFNFVFQGDTNGQ